MTALSSRQGQRGAALLMAMVIVTVVATIASSMVWQQWRAVQVESAERGRQQLEWLLVGAVDFSRLILKDDGYKLQTDGSPQPTHLGQNWARALQETRISSFLSVDKDNTDDAPDAFLSGKVADVNALYNLRNVIDMSATPAPKVDPAQVLVLQALFTSIRDVPPTLATQIAEALEKATLAALNTNAAYAALGGSASNLASAPLMPQKLDQLVWLLPSLDSATIEKIRPYVTLLPLAETIGGGGSNINPNTAPREVLAAVLGIDLATADRLVRYRQSQYFKDRSEVMQQAGLTADPAVLDVTSKYFEVTGTLRLENQIMKQRSLVRRTGSGKQVDVVVIRQELFSGVDPGP
ncbi:MAG: general secretion pathway protein GspK [Rubrivivax sp.]|nr:MAG: general secretion pathway protein GspK [Rubrivivax sp.]